MHAFLARILPFEAASDGALLAFPVLAFVAGASGRRTSGGRFSLHNGLMVLSKYPIVHTQFHKFEDVGWHFESMKIINPMP